MKANFNDILAMIQFGGALAAIGTGNPAISAGVQLGTSMIKVAHDAYVSGRDRGEWTPDQEKHFDEVVLPQITSQAHWQS